MSPEQKAIGKAKLYPEKRGYVVVKCLMSITDVADMLHCSKQHIHNMLRNSATFPKPYQIGIQSLSNGLGFSAYETRRWKVEEILAWL